MTASLLRKSSCAAIVFAMAGLAGADVTPLRFVDGFAALGPPRSLRARLSVDAAWQPCAVGREKGGDEGMVCADPSNQRLVVLPVAAVAQAGASPSADALHALALADLLAAAAGGTNLDRAIQSFQSAARLADRPAPVLADLAAALLLRAERTQNVRDVAEAIEVSEEAVELEARNPAVLFNRALAMEQWGLVDQSSVAWLAYRDVDSRSGWAGEARARSVALSSKPSPHMRPRDFSPSAVREFVVVWPQQARQLGWDHLLGEWGAAVLTGDFAGAERVLGEAELLGNAMKSQGGDPTLAEAVREIRGRPKNGIELSELALAHREYAAAFGAFHRLDYYAMRDSLSAAAGRPHGSRILSLWIRTSYGSALLLTGDVGGAKRVLIPLLAEADTDATPAIAGRVHWSLGTMQLRLGIYEEALAEAQRGSELLRRAGDDEYSGGSAYVAADAAFSLGATIEAYGEAHGALVLLRRYPASVWTSNALSSAARIAAADGRRRAAARFLEERLGVATRMGVPARVAEVQAARAQALLTAGDLNHAARAVTIAESLVAGLDSGVVRSWISAELQLARARVRLVLRPAESEVLFDSVLATPVTRFTVFRVLQALAGRAQARLAGGDVAGAIADLDSACAQIDREQQSVMRASYRASLLDAATDVFNRVASLRLVQGDTVGALLSIDRRRVFLTPGSHASSSPALRDLRMPPGVVGLEYALIGDTLLVWTVSGRRVLLSRVRVKRDLLVGASERVRVALQRGEAESRVRPQLAILYRLLIQPVASRLGPANTRLLVVSDGDVPADLFAALFDSTARRYLIEDHPLVFAPALHGSVREAPQSRTTMPRVLIASDPAFDPRSYPGLERLPEAEVEGDSVGALYDHTVRLNGPEVTPSALFVAVRRVNVVHLAGHAFFDDEQPDRSYVVLAPERGVANSVALTADSLGRAQWGGVRLVVLSACETFRSRRGRSGGFAGFSAALLGAGVGGVIGTSWAVDDRSSRYLMVEFHRAYRVSGDGAGALRTAQLRLLRSSDPSLRSPTAWAAFRYAGN